MLFFAIFDTSFTFDTDQFLQSKPHHRHMTWGFCGN